MEKLGFKKSKQWWHTSYLATREICKRFSKGSVIPGGK